MDHYIINNNQNDLSESQVIYDSYKISNRDILLDLQNQFTAPKQKLNLFTEESALKQYINENKIDYNIEKTGASYYEGKNVKFVNLTESGFNYTNGQYNNNLENWYHNSLFKQNEASFFIDYTFKEKNQGIIFITGHEVAHHLFSIENETNNQYLYKSENFQSPEIDLVNKLLRAGISGRYRDGSPGGNALYYAAVSSDEMHSDMTVVASYLKISHNRNPEVSKLIEQDMLQVADKRKERMLAGDYKHITSGSIRSLIEKLNEKDGNYSVSKDEFSQIIAESTIDVLKAGLKNTQQRSLVMGYFAASGLNDNEIKKLNIDKKDLLPETLNKDFLTGYFLRKNNFKYAFDYDDTQMLNMSEKEATTTLGNKSMQNIVKADLKNSYADIKPDFKISVPDINGVLSRLKQKQELENKEGLKTTFNVSTPKFK